MRCAQALVVRLRQALTILLLEAHITFRGTAAVCHSRK